MGKHVGSFIRQLREKRGLSQAEVAKLLSLKTAQSVSNIERGVSPLPRAKIRRLADILGIRKREIVTVVMREVQDQVWRAAGVAELSSEDFALLSSLADKLRAAKKPQRVLLKRRVKKILDH